VSIPMWSKRWTGWAHTCGPSPPSTSNPPTARTKCSRPVKKSNSTAPPTCKCAGKHREFFYDGKTFTLFGRRVNYYATVPAPPTLRELIVVLAEKYGIEVPLSDLFFWGTEDSRAATLRSAIDLGPATVGGTECEQYALRQEGVDWQVWIQKGDAPLPRKLVITTTSDPAQPQYVSVLKWNLNPKLNDATFSFSPPPGAMRIVLETADGKVAPQSQGQG
jgi:hypothetical protein